MPQTLDLLVLCWVLGPGHTDAGSPGWFQNISTSLFSSPGDITLGGLFPINSAIGDLSRLRDPDDIRCERLDEFGLGLALVMKFAVEEINGNQTLLPGVRLGYQIHDTCRQSPVVVKAALSFLTDKSSRALSVRCNYTDYEPGTSAVIGPLSSEMVPAIGKLLGFFLMPQVSFGATSDKFSDRKLYPSFFRTVPSDKLQVKAMARLLQEFKWTWVAVVGSEEEYGQHGVREFSRTAENMSICVAYQGLIPVYEDPEPAVGAIVDNIQKSGVGVVIVFALEESAKLLFQEVIRRNMSGVWIASTTWAIKKKITLLPGVRTVGTVLGFIHKTQSLDLLPAYARELFSRLGGEGMETPPRPPGQPDPCPGCRRLSAANASLMTDAAVQQRGFSVYAAIYSVAQALHNMLRCTATGCEWSPGTRILPWKLLKFLQKVSLDVKGARFEFNRTGSAVAGFNVVHWVWTDSGVDVITVGGFDEELSIRKPLLRWHTEDSEVPRSTCSPECGVGQVHRLKGFHSCCFDCIDCLPGTYLRQKDDIKCTPCPEGQWSRLRGTNCTRPSFEVLSWRSPEAPALVVTGLLLLGCQAWAGAVLLRNRGTPLVRASGGDLGLVALLSLAGAGLSLPLFLARPGDVVCRLQLPLLSLFQTVALSVITFISLQIFAVMEFPERSASILRTLRGPVRWIFPVGCCLLQAGLCGWFLRGGPSLSQHMARMQIDFLRGFLSCPVTPLLGFALMQGFNCLMALISFTATFMAAKPVHQYNLARDVTFSTLIYSHIWVAFIPAYIGLSQKSQAISLVSFTLAGNFSLVVGYYLPKCHLLLRRPELNTPEHFCTFLEGAPLTSAPQEPQPPQPPPAK